jgi:hypothetical protein
MAFDIYYSEDVHRRAKRDKGIDYLLGAYFSTLNLDRGYAEIKTYDDTIKEDVEKTEDGNRIASIEEVKENKELKISPKSVKFWGVGYEPDEYKRMDDEYSSWVVRANNGEAPSKSLENTIKEICKTQIDIERKRKEGGKAGELASLQSVHLKLMESAGLKPIQEDTTNIAERNALGVLIDVWESTEPVPRYEEENKIKKYVTSWFKGSLARAADLPNDTKEEYMAELDKYKVKIMEDPPSEEGDSGG